MAVSTDTGFDLAILYRGPLSSCNYECGYCPFAKTEDSPAALGRDREALERFVAFIEKQRGRPRRLGILFTPWGEALVRGHYRDAIVRLSHIEPVRKVAVQTNLSCRLDWLSDARRDRVGLWCTYHPSQAARPRFVAQCRRLDALGISHSVGVVGLKEHLGEIEALRRELPPSVYLWVNAYKREPSYYDAETLSRLTRIDPHFPVNNKYHRSQGEPCGAGERAIAVDGDGNMRRCHFIEEPIGNIYEEEWEQSLRPRTCSRETCGCHIGYVHLDRLGLSRLYGKGLLERTLQKMGDSPHFSL